MNASRKPSGRSLLGGPRARRPRLSKAFASSVILTPESRRCLQNLASYEPPHPPEDQELLYPLSRSAAVLIALFVGRAGDLYVVLSRRAETLRTFPGDTSLPGGRYEPGDKNLEDTARREAFEEIGLPRDRQRIPLLCTLQPFVTGTNLLVTPVVVLILDPDIRPILNEPEVAALFSHPFRSFLARKAPFMIRHEPHSTSHPNASAPAEMSSVPSSPTSSASQTAAGRWKRPSSISPIAPGENAVEDEYYTYQDLPWGESTVRMHRFLTGREEQGVKPVFGLTAAILLHAAMIGYGQDPEFPPRAPTEKTIAERVAYSLRTVPVLRDAVRREHEEREKRRRSQQGYLRTRRHAKQLSNSTRTKNKL